MKLLRVPLGKHFGIVGEEWNEHEVSLDLSNSDSSCMQTPHCCNARVSCVFTSSLSFHVFTKQPSKDVSLCPCHPHGVLSENPHPPSLLQTARNARQTNVFLRPSPAIQRAAMSSSQGYARARQSMERAKKYLHIFFCSCVFLCSFSVFTVRFSLLFNVKRPN